MDIAKYALAFWSGLISFFLPCILPLLPVYFGYLAGEAITNLEDVKIKKRLMLNALGFVLGITFLNIVLGFGVKAISDFLVEYSDLMRIFGGILMLLFGIYFIVGMKWLFMEKERKVKLKNYSPNFIKSFLLGITFSFGWTPCTGPILTSISFMASFEKDYLKAGTLMLSYSIGFSIMFLLSAFLVGTFIKKVKKIYPYLDRIKQVAGLLMIIMGILLLFNQTSIFNIFL